MSIINSAAKNFPSHRKPRIADRFERTDLAWEEEDDFSLSFAWSDVVYASAVPNTGRMAV